MTNHDILPYITDRHVLAGTLWAEARSEPVEGRIAVACVIRNRSTRRRQTLRTVCLAPAQFSCWQAVGGEKNHDALFALLRKLPQVSDALFRECVWIADGLISRALLDSVDGSDHYLTTALYHADPPSWAKTMPVVAVIGRHTFLRSGDPREARA